MPRTGGHSGYAALGVKPKSPLHAPMCEIKHKSYFSFGFIRNPWDRMYSCYRRQKSFSIYLGVSFKDYLMNRIEKDGVSRSAMTMLDGCSFIGRYESMDADWNLIGKVLGINIQKMPHINKYGESDYRNHYDDEMIEFVKNRYADDIEYGSYEF